MKATIYKHRREQLVASISKHSTLILAGNSQLERTRDVAYPFRQSNNFVYLSGIDIPDAYLVIQSGAERLYIKRLHPFMAAWEGRTNQIEELKKQSAIADIVEYQDIAEVLTDLGKVTYIDMPDEPTAQIAAWQLWHQIKESYPDQELAAINPILEQMRMIKSKAEVELIERAIAVTDELLQQVRPLLTPGVTERAIAAQFVNIASQQGIDQAWPPIVSFGKNSCIIHHTPDDTRLTDGDLVLFDVGVEVEGYASDISRMVQIGQPSQRQKQVLEAVKSVQADALQLMKPGIAFDEFERRAGQIMAHKLVELGLFKDIDEANQLEGELQWPAYRRYFNHMTSHYLGLDAHDVGTRDAVFAPGMVLTCEPGIYIAEEAIGVRIEDDILITDDGNRNLSQNVVLDN